jgi:ABC-type amino acid transport substrate-binding protein
MGPPRLGTYALILIAALALDVRTGAAAGPLATGAPGATLRVGIATNYPPMAFKENGQVTGVEADFATLLGKDLGLKVTLVETPWEELIPALRNGQIDVIMSGMSITAAREKLVSFTQPYLKISQMALYRAADEARFRKRAEIDAAKVRIGVVSGTTGEQYARKNHPHAQVKGFTTVDEGVAALRKGDIDVFVHDAPAIWRVTGGLDSPERELAGYYEPLTQEQLAWAVRKPDGALRTRLNRLLGKWKADGQLESVIDHWIPVRKQLIRPRPKP